MSLAHLHHGSTEGRFSTRPCGAEAHSASQVSISHLTRPTPQVLRRLRPAGAQGLGNEGGKSRREMSLLARPMDVRARDILDLPVPMSPRSGPQAIARPLSRRNRPLAVRLPPSVFRRVGRPPGPRLRNDPAAGRFSPGPQSPILPRSAIEWRGDATGLAKCKKDQNKQDGE